MKSLAVVLVSGIVCGCILVAPPPAGPPPEGAPPGFTPMGPVRCSGGQRIRLEAVYIRVPGTAVAVSGGCDLKIRHSQIIGDVALAVSGGGDVEIDDSFLEGPVSIALSGGADVTIGHSTIRGPVQRSGGADVHDRGGNLWQ